MASPRTPRPKKKVPAIDRDKLRAMLRRIGDEYVFYMLDDAIDALPPAKLAKIVGQYIRLEQLRPDADARATKRSLVEDVRAFAAACLRGEYYVSLNVDSKNYMEKSTGTRAFIAECGRLLDCCVAAPAKADPAETSEAFGTLASLLRRLDEGHDDIVFFADEGGSWEVGVDWKTVFPVWFRCLARSAQPDDFARVVVEAIDDLTEGERNTHLATARKLASPAQRLALEARARRR